MEPKLDVDRLRLIQYLNECDKHILKINHAVNKMKSFMPQIIRAVLAKYAACCDKNTPVIQIKLVFGQERKHRSVENGKGVWLVTEYAKLGIK